MVHGLNEGHIAPYKNNKQRQKAFFLNLGDWLNIKIMSYIMDG